MLIYLNCHNIKDIVLNINQSIKNRNCNEKEAQEYLYTLFNKSKHILHNGNKLPHTCTLCCFSYLVLPGNKYPEDYSYVYAIYIENHCENIYAFVIYNCNNHHTVATLPNTDISSCLYTPYTFDNNTFRSIPKAIIYTNKYTFSHNINVIKIEYIDTNQWNDLIVINDLKTYPIITNYKI